MKNNIINAGKKKVKQKRTQKSCGSKGYAERYRRETEEKIFI